MFDSHPIGCCCSFCYCNQRINEWGKKQKISSILLHRPTSSTNLHQLHQQKLTTDTNTDHIPPERFQDAGYRANFCTIRHHRRFPRGWPGKIPVHSKWIQARPCQCKFSVCGHGWTKCGWLGFGGSWWGAIAAAVFLPVTVARRPDSKVWWFHECNATRASTGQRSLEHFTTQNKSSRQSIRQHIRQSSRHHIQSAKWEIEGKKRKGPYLRTVLCRNRPRPRTILSIVEWLAVASTSPIEIDWTKYPPSSTCTQVDTHRHK